MSARFQELDWRHTSMGELVLRRRWDGTVGSEVYEVKLDDEYLMSSLFTVAEEAIAHRALEELSGAGLDIAVGGLGLGYTALAALRDERVGSLVVVDALAEVIEWHRRGLVPAGAELAADPRCTMLHGDFFTLLEQGSGLRPGATDNGTFDAVLVDIDHSPRHLLHPDHAGFYRAEGLGRLAAHLRPGGVFTLWSNDPPDDEFTEALTGCFAEAGAEVVRFPNPLQGREATATVYLARTHPQ
ncbi:Spermine/spermidine synthase [Haloechinothrix alba]|uniref:Spermine/spermidine synthase n=1 Tax=Haloechinothrix alba TaxID=664784 RepID=A0A238ZHA8_9PSEU|nr:spermidine synthase [Haloechinothrix alba]SNR82083.1 Spermine/spermidine synthase [Haloechinothrix alba]